MELMEFEGLYFAPLNSFHSGQEAYEDTALVMSHDPCWPLIEAEGDPVPARLIVLAGSSLIADEWKDILDVQTGEFTVHLNIPIDDVLMEVVLL